MDENVKYYNERAEETYQNALKSDTFEDREKFLSVVPQVRGKKILDLGSGVGKDAYLMTCKGYNVIPVEASENLCEYIRKAGLSPLCMDMRDIDFHDEFSGVWCNASIQHISKSEARILFYKIFEALVLEGVFFVSFKEKIIPSSENDFRTYESYSETEIEKMAEIAGFKKMKFWRKKDSLGRDFDWLCYVFYKPVGFRIFS